MKVLYHSEGLFRILPLPVASYSESAHSREGIESALRRHVRADGTIEGLCIDFAGEYIPLSHEQELPMLARMLAAYGHHSNTSDQVCQHISM